METKVRVALVQAAPVLMAREICWENYMPLARTAMYAQGVEFYIAPTADAREVWQSTIRHIALEGRCFVLSCNQFVTKEMYPKDLACFSELENEPEVMRSGGSAIVGPLRELKRLVMTTVNISQDGIRNNKE